MLTVTDAVLAHFAHILQEHEAANAVLRVRARQDHFELFIDEARSGDNSFAFEGRIVLVHEDGLSDALTGRTLDLEMTFEGTGLTLN